MYLELIDEHPLIALVIGERRHDGDIVGQAYGAERFVVPGARADRYIVGEMGSRRRRTAITDKENRVAGCARIQQKADESRNLVAVN